MDWLDDIFDLAKLVAKWITEGLSAEEIAKRIADPNSVGGGMLKRAVARRERGKDLLGR